MGPILPICCNLFAVLLLFKKKFEILRTQSRLRKEELRIHKGNTPNTHAFLTAPIPSSHPPNPQRTNHHRAAPTRRRKRGYIAIRESPAFILPHPHRFTHFLPVPDAQGSATTKLPLKETPKHWEQPPPGQCPQYHQCRALTDQVYLPEVAAPSP